MTFDWILPLIIAFAITAIIGPKMLPLLARLKFGQFVREDGPQSHLKKQGTPTMGGLIFLIAIIITSLLFISGEFIVLPILLVMVGFGIVGFLDDYLKIKKKQSEGLKAYQKLLLQVIISVLYLVFLVFGEKIETGIIIPFTHGTMFELGFFYIPIMLVVMLGTVNGVNLTDGVDGLATSVTSIVALLFIFVALLNDVAYSLFPAIVLGALLGFLLINVHPAKIFMGDTGSLALGGFVVAIAIGLKIPLFILLFGIIYLIETLSVMIQVSYYKRTKKRVFKMAPIHHHFELSGMAETQIVAFFTIVTIIMSLITVLALH